MCTEPMAARAASCVLSGVVQCGRVFAATTTGSHTPAAGSSCGNVASPLKQRRADLTMASAHRSSSDGIADLLEEKVDEERRSAEALEEKLREEKVKEDRAREERREERAKEKVNVHSRGIHSLGQRTMSLAVGLAASNKKKEARASSRPDLAPSAVVRAMKRLDSEDLGRKGGRRSRSTSVPSTAATLQRSETTACIVGGGREKSNLRTSPSTGSRSNSSSPRVDDDDSERTLSPRHCATFVKVQVGSVTKVVPTAANDTAHTTAVRLMHKLCLHSYGSVTQDTLEQTRRAYAGYYLFFETLQGQWKLCEEGGEVAVRERYSLFFRVKGDGAAKCDSCSFPPLSFELPRLRNPTNAPLQTYLDVNPVLTFRRKHHASKMALHRVPIDVLLSEHAVDLQYCLGASELHSSSESAATPPRQPLRSSRCLTQSPATPGASALNRGDSGYLRVELGGRRFMIGGDDDEDVDSSLMSSANEVTLAEATADTLTDDGDASEFGEEPDLPRGMFVEDWESDDEKGESEAASAAPPPVEYPSVFSRAFAELISDVATAAPRIAGFFFCDDPLTVFEKKAVLGKGAYGEVFAAVYRATGEEVAVKVMPLLSELDRDSKKLATELKLLALCDHPNIIKLTAWRCLPCDSKGCFYNDDELVMSLCVNGSLGSILKETAYTVHEDQAQVITKQIVRGLAYLHSLGIIHRDMKLENVLIGRDGQIKLADLGVSGICSTTEDQAMSVAGTTYWLAPEMAVGGHYDTSADIWSLGITMIELFERYPPYWDLLPVRQLFMLTSEDVEVPRLKETEHISQDAIEFLSLCLRRDPKQRPSAVQLLQHPWLAEGIPMQYESIFIRYVQQHTADLLEDLQSSTQGESEVSGGELGASGNVIEISSSDDDEYRSSSDEEAEVASPRDGEPQKILRRAIFFAKEKPIETLTELIDEMRFGQSPIVVKNRKYRLRRYKNTFVGREAVDWIMVRMDYDTRQDAEATGQLLMKRGIIKHVCDAMPFVDGHCFYQFTQDVEASSSKKKRSGKSGAPWKNISGFAMLRSSGNSSGGDDLSQRRRRSHSKPRPSGASGVPSSSLPSPDELLSPRARKAVEEDALAVENVYPIFLAMQQPAPVGVTTTDTRHGLSRSHVSGFTGRDGVAWMMLMLDVPELIATRLLQSMMDLRLIKGHNVGKTFRYEASEIYMFRKRKGLDKSVEKAMEEG